jgi:hypothetical protein
MVGQTVSVFSSEYLLDQGQYKDKHEWHTNDDVIVGLEGLSDCSKHPHFYEHVQRMPKIKRPLPQDIPIMPLKIQLAKFGTFRWEPFTCSTVGFLFGCRKTTLSPGTLFLWETKHFICFDDVKHRYQLREAAPHILAQFYAQHTDPIFHPNLQAIIISYL